MSQENNYADEAMELCGAPDPIIARTAKSLFGAIFHLAQSEQTPPPLEGFNMHYFFLGVIRCLRESRLEKIHACNGCVIPKVAINVVNMPNKDEMSNYVGIYTIPYYNSVLMDSVLDGDPFDVKYALTIVDFAFPKKEATDWIFEPQAVEKHFDASNPEDFDDWLSGFSSEPH